MTMMNKRSVSVLAGLALAGTGSVGLSAQAQHV